MKKVISFFAAGMLLHAAVFAQSLTILFENGQYALNEQSKVDLLNLIASNSTIETEWSIAGHTDDVGPEPLNEKLSQQRALSVLDFLIKNGVDDSSTSVLFFGEKKPVAPNDGPEGKQKNRRVDVSVKTKKNARCLSDFEIPFKEFVIDPSKATTLTLDNKGTTLHIPENCFTDIQNNSILDGDVKIKYREYCNSADMAFSGIPMTYHENQQEYSFNSAGMFEIQGTCNDQPLHIAQGKSITIDYALAKKNPDISFFNLDKYNGDWIKIQEIPTNGAPEKTQDRALETRSPIDEEQELIVAEYRMKRVAGPTEDIKPTFITKEKTFKLKSLLNDSRMLGGGVYSDPGHTYPDVIRGLNVGAFGVYNCDQIYRVKEPIDVLAHYEDHSGQPIADATVLSLIDLNYNGAFSFDPKRFTCSAIGNNALVLFTKSGKLYLLMPDDFKEMHISKGGAYTFKMTDVTEQIKRASDLAALLGI